jgi:prepilin-type N-terminal cleavage/methylation domain-containing protein
MNSAIPTRNGKREAALDRNSPAAGRLSPSSCRVSQHGFTLLEVLVATGVLALMVTILFSLFAEGSNAWRLGERRADVNQGMRIALGMIAREASLAVISTNQANQLAGLAVNIHRPATGDDPAPSSSTQGACEELCFVAPVDIGNEATNDTYRALCGVRYYVAKAPPVGGQPAPVLGNLMRVLYKTYPQGGAKSTGQFSLYATDWSLGGVPAGCYSNSTVIAENVLSFRVQPARYDQQYALMPLNNSMFSDMKSDMAFVINASTFQLVNNEASPSYPGLVIGLCVVDSRLASLINKVGLDNAGKMQGFLTTTNWVVIHFENYKRGGT